MEVRKGTTENVSYTQTILLVTNGSIDSVIREPNVAKIGGVFIANPASTYQFATITKVRIDLVDGTGINIELQKITNQPTWSTGTNAGVEQAIQDLNDFLRT